MKLSEAMRIGAKIRPQAYNVFFDRIDGEFCSCAFGAVLEAEIGFLDQCELLSIRLEQIHNIHEYIIDPILNIQSSIYRVVTFLNDTEKWTREAIADYLESQGY